MKGEEELQLRPWIQQVQLKEQVDGLPAESKLRADKILQLRRLETDLKFEKEYGKAQYLEFYSDKKIEIYNEGGGNRYCRPDRSKATTAPWSYEQQQVAAFESERVRRALERMGELIR